MRPLTARTISYLGLGVLLALGMLGCGGSRVRSQDGAVTEDPEPEPPTGFDAAPATGDPGAPPGLDAATAISPDGPRPPSSPVPEPGPPPETCGGVTCPALFALVHPCRPMGMCTINILSPIPLTFCYANGIEVVAENIVPPDLVGLVKRADGRDCYRARVTEVPGSTDRHVVWETPAGAPVASGVIDGSGNGTITCDGITAPLTDPTCVAVPSAEGCMPGVCFVR
jgi:hypothetical protein